MTVIFDAAVMDFCFMDAIVAKCSLSLAAVMERFGMPVLPLPRVDCSSMWCTSAVDSWQEW